MQTLAGVTVGNEVVGGDVPTLVGADDVLDAAVRDVLGPDDEDIDAVAVGAGYRAAVAAALPAGVRLRGLVFTGPTPTPANAAAAIRAAVSGGGAVDVVAHLASDAHAARLLRAAVRRTEAELARVRAAQRENARRRAAEGVPKARIARDLGVQRVTVDAWLRTPRPSEAAPPTPTGPAPTAAPAEPADRTRLPDMPTAAADTAGDAHATATRRPRRTDRAAPTTRTRGPALLRFDAHTVRLHRWSDHPGGWLVHADDRHGQAIVIGHLVREDGLDGRTRGWQPLDEQRHRITGIGALPKTRPAAVAVILHAHEQRHTAAARRHRLDRAVHPDDR